MAKEKVFTPEVIRENPFPEDLPTIETQSQSIVGGNFTPKTNNERKFPRKRSSVELLSTVMNTRTRKILQEFKLEQSGGFQIGEFKKGVTGDMRLTPNGMTSRNKAGLTTFAIDGSTGSAVFLGTVRAGSLISDSTIEGGSINVNDKFTVDDKGNVVITEGNITIKDEDETTIIDSKGVVSTALNTFTGSSNASLNQDFTTSSQVDVTGSSLTIVVPRNAVYLFLVKCTIFSAALDSSNKANLTIRLKQDATERERLTYGGVNVAQADINLKTLSLHYLATLSAATHTFKLTGELETKTGNPTFTLHAFRLTYIRIGN